MLVEIFRKIVFLNLAAIKDRSIFEITDKRHMIKSLHLRAATIISSDMYCCISYIVLYCAAAQIKYNI